MARSAVARIGSGIAQNAGGVGNQNTELGRWRAIDMAEIHMDSGMRLVV